MISLCAATVLGSVATALPAEDLQPGPLELLDVFELEYARDPRISPDGGQVVYVRTFHDVLRDARRSNLWIVDADGENHRPLTSGSASAASPRWSPDGERLLYVSSGDGSTQLFVRWMDTGQTAQVTRLTEAPSSIVWSPDGRSIAFTMKVEEDKEPIATLPAKPEGAEWAPAAKVIQTLSYRFDGEGYRTHGYDQLFVVPAEGGTPRALTSGPYDVQGTPSWTPDGGHLLFASNRREDADFFPLDSEIYRVALADGALEPLTDRYGPDADPRVSPDGSRVAYLGFDDEHQGYQVTRVYLMEADGGSPRCLTEALDRSVDELAWAADGRSLYVQYDDFGRTRIDLLSLEGRLRPLTVDVGGVTLGRPYASGGFSVSRNGRVAFPRTRPDRPADVALCEGPSAPRPAAASTGAETLPAVRLLTGLNEDLLGQRALGEVDELWCQSSHDGRDVQAWVVHPPEFDAEGKYPLLLEIHGGPFANYGPRFSAECQLYAAAGYVVLYVNPRGSTSYGEEFGNLIHHAYPGHDYDDLMSAVDAVLARGYVDPERLYVTGGSGGGVLTSWIVGKTDRFRAAVVAKPVINWASFALTADAYTYFYKYWFPGPPWEHPELYWSRSPLSLVGNVTTPTMLLTGEADYRTPISESEQYYQALQLNKVESALVRIPEASHGIAARPSNLMAKVAYVLGWFARYGGPQAEAAAEEPSAGGSGAAGGH